jgi:tetratricopeptide (TPR) repeat protein
LELMFAVRTLLTGLFPRRRVVQEPPGYARGLAALEAGDYHQACAAFTEAFALAAQAGETAAQARALNKRGVAHVRAGRRSEGLADFEAALALSPRFAPSLVNVGNLQLEAGNVAEAIASYEAALRGDDRYAPAYANLGVAYRKLGRYDESVRALKKATRIELLEGRATRGGLGRA